MTTGESLNFRLFFPIFLFLTISLLSVASVPCRAYELLLGAGEDGTFSNFSGRTICRAINKHGTDLSCKVVTASGYTHNLTNLQGGSLDLALVNSKLIRDALTHSGFFQYMDIKYDNLRSLLPIYKMPVSLLVRQDGRINTLDDIQGKRVNGGEPQSLQELVFGDVMGAIGWKRSDFSLYQNLSTTSAQDLLAFNNGTVQAMLHIGVHPDDKIHRQVSRSRGKIVGLKGAAIDRLIAAKKGYSRSVIPAGTYSMISTDLETIALESLLITNEDLDDATAKTVMEAVLSSKSQLHQAHPCLLSTDIKMDSGGGSDLAPHPAAASFYKLSP